ncbi:hypothetical protein AB0K16_22535 [Nonomuraea jabiensis]|uniref:T4 family baseplate hub assembly chaperone n=1 Tax=Nonomuraea jabiensis TaxID=882448 RepID=UPI00341E6966
MNAYYGGNDPFADARSPVEDPTVARDMHATISQAIQSATIADAETDIVHLPVPAVINGTQIRTAQVRELTGEDEEKLHRAMLSEEPERILDTLLQCGVVKLGELTPNAADLLDLAVASRDELLLGIRRVTYGKEVKIEELRCLHCGAKMYVSYDLDDVPRSAAANGLTDWRTTVKLRKGGTAVLRLPSGADQLTILGEIRERSINRAEQDTLLIARCLENVTLPDGTIQPSGGITQAKAFGMADRAAIVKAMDENRPGPHLEDAKVTCPDCEKETGVPLSVDILFRG